MIKTDRAYYTQVYDERYPKVNAAAAADDDDDDEFRACRLFSKSDAHYYVFGILVKFHALSHNGFHIRPTCLGLQAYLSVYSLSVGVNFYRAAWNADAV